ncbi:MAG: hypothetical protein M3680_15825 [Myxococcota bacterium]|nr:hypothetical protein [Myxococcota bacterium]
MQLPPYLLTAACALAVGAACGSAPAATAEFFGPTIEPPRGLSKLHPGMSVAEAKQRVPELREDHGGVRDKLVLDSGVSDVKLEVRVDAGTVSSILAVVQGHGARELLTRTWGEPQITRDSLGQAEVTWASEASGWKVELDCLERNCVIEYLPYHVLTAELFGAHVVPPRELASLRVGMPLAEARKLAPGPVDVRGGIASGVDGVRHFVAVDDKRGIVRGIYVNLPSHAKDLIEEAWGKGLAATEPVGKQVLVWPDPTTGWRATLRPALGRSFDLAFDNYLPAAQLFGEQPDVVDAAPVLGLTVEEVKRTYDVTAQGKDLVLTLLPTEWERTATKVTLGTSGGRIRELTLAIPFKAHPSAKDTLHDLFRAKWGEPRPSMADGKLLVFRDGQPRVEVREDPEHDVWRLEIR